MGKVPVGLEWKRSRNHQEERDRQLALMVITSYCSVKYHCPVPVPKRGAKLDRNGMGQVPGTSTVEGLKRRGIR
jgi:hypothetical protein